MHVPLIEEDGFEYIERGEGKPIILLHGLFGALSNFKDVLGHFSRRYKVVILKLPIYDLPLLKTNVRTLSEHLDKFIEHKKFHQVIVLGNSLGGHVGLDYAALHPEKVEALILTGSSGLYENAFGGSFPRRGDKSYLRKKIELTFYDPAMTTDVLVDECYEAVNNRNKIRRIIAFARSAIRHNMLNDLHNINMPTCLIWGRNDTITPPEVAEIFHENIKDSDLSWIEKCGHVAMMEHPSTFNHLVNEWLNKKNI